MRRAEWWPRGVARGVWADPASGFVVARAAWRLRRRGWWWRPPFLPLPDRAYWHFRMVTATGETASRPSWSMVVDAARWARRQARRQ